MYNVEKLENSHLWCNFRVACNNNHEYLDITELAKNIKIIKALPEYMRFPKMTILQHFSKKKETRPIMMQKYEISVDVFLNLGDFPLNIDTFDVLEEFICHL